MSVVIQPSFSKGELSPELHGRVDVSAYNIGLATARNVVIRTYGGVNKRPGLTYLGPVQNHSYTPRLIPFTFNSGDQYVLEFGHQYMRVIRNNSHVFRDTPVSISSIVNGNPVTIATTNPHFILNGDEVQITNLSSIPEINNQRFIAKSVTLHSIKLTYQNGAGNVDGSMFTLETPNPGYVNKIYQITTPYDIADIFDVKFVQNADVITLTHKNYRPQELSRFDHNNWTLNSARFTNDVNKVTGMVVVVNTPGTTRTKYTVTTTNINTGEESFAGLAPGLSILNISQSAHTPIHTVSAHGLIVGDEIYITDVDGMTELNVKRFIVDNIIDTTHFTISTLDGDFVDSRLFGAYTSGGGVYPTFIRPITSASTYKNTITWNTVFPGAKYNIYREKQGIYGLIAQTNLLTFTDDNINPDTSNQPPVSRNPFDKIGNYPGAVGYYSQRRVFGGSDSKPDTSEFSQIGRQNNYARHDPAQDDDCITATLNADDINEIRHYVPIKSLLTFTNGSEWVINSGPDSVFTGDTIRQNRESIWGSSHLRPMIIGNTVFYTTPNRVNVRTLSYNYQNDAYEGENLNIFSRHLLDGYTISDWCWTVNPDTRIYMARSDGKGICLSYDKDQQVIAWSWIETLGKFEACTCLHNTSSDVIYWVVNRNINGRTVRYIEYSSQPAIYDAKSSFYVDAGITTQSPISINGIVVEGNAVIRVISHGHGLIVGDEIDIIDVEYPATIGDWNEPIIKTGLNNTRFKVIGVSNDAFIITYPNGDYPDINLALYAINSTGTIYKAVDTVTGYNHLEGQSVACLCDGNVIRNKIVSVGSVSFDRKFSIITIGLPYVTDIETLNIEEPIQGAKTLQGRLKRVTKVALKFYKSRAVFVGPDVNKLTEMKQRTDESMGDPTILFTGDREIVISPSWNSNGRVFIRQKDPLPLNLLDIIPHMDWADD